jgi:hypothetical protein
MNTPSTIDELIDHEHAAAVKQEEDSLAIERRLRLADLPLSDKWFSVQRHHGEIRNPYAGRHKNLTMRTHLERLDPQLASYLARLAGTTVAATDYAAREREEARQAAAQRMVEETERLRQQNEATRQRQDQARHMNLRPVPGNPGEFRL